MSKIFRQDASKNIIIKESVADNLKDSVFDRKSKYWITNNKVEYLQVDENSVQKKEGFITFKVDGRNKKVSHMGAPLPGFEQEQSFKDNHVYNDEYFKKYYDNELTSTDIQEIIAKR